MNRPKKTPDKTCLEDKTMLTLNFVQAVKTLPPRNSDRANENRDLPGPRDQVTRKFLDDLRIKPKR